MKQPFIFTSLFLRTTATPFITLQSRPSMLASMPEIKPQPRFSEAAVSVASLRRPSMRPAMEPPSPPEPTKEQYVACNEQKELHVRMRRATLKHDHSGKARP